MNMKCPVGRPYLSPWFIQTFRFCWVCMFVYLKVLFSDFIDWGINILRLVKLKYLHRLNYSNFIYITW